MWRGGGGFERTRRNSPLPTGQQKETQARRKLSRQYKLQVLTTLSKKIPQLQQEQSVQVTQPHLLRRQVYRHQ